MADEKDDGTAEGPPPLVDVADGRDGAGKTDVAGGEKSGDDKSGGDGKKDDGPPSRPFYKRPLLMAFLVLTLLGAAVGGFLYWEYARQYESTDDAFLDAHVVRIDAKLTGYVVQLLVDDNQLVAAGDLLGRIDPRDYQAELDQAKAGEEAARASLRQAQAQLDQSRAAKATAEANIASAVAASKRDVAELDRLKKLRGTSSISAEEYSTGQAAAEASTAGETAARAKFNEAEASVATSQAAGLAAKAQLEVAVAKTRAAEVTLSYCTITAPVPGRVTRRTVEQGNLVRPGTSLLALVEQNPWVTANFKETQLTHMKQGQAVTVTIDAYPGRDLSAKVDSFQRGSGQRFSLLPPENATGNYVKVVQRVPVKIRFDEPPPADMVLGPGMSVVPTVKVR